jgi:hypothetical protein
MMAFAGSGGIAMFVTANTTIQLTVPDHLRGRVMSLYTTSFSLSVPVGGLVMGAVGSAAGVPVALGLGGALTALVGVAGLAWMRTIPSAQEPEHVVPVAADAAPVAGVEASLRTLRRP